MLVLQRTEEVLELNTLIIWTDVLFVFLDEDASCKLDIESIVDTPLHIFEVHVHIPVLIDLKDSLGYLGAGCLSMIHNLFKDFFGKKNRL